MRNKLFINASVLSLILAVFLLCGAGDSAAGSSAAELMEKMKPAPGWSGQGEPDIYHADNLWEYINGSAEKFLSYDFVETAVQDYTDSKGLELKVEIYQHGSSLMAYGIYSQFSMGRKESDLAGTLSFGGDYSLHFWKGNYYVKISVFEKSEYLADEMKKFARAIAAGIKEEGSLPEAANYLPEDGLDSTRIGYMAEGALGSGEMPPAVTAEYNTEEGKGKLYLFTFDTARESMALFKKLAQKIKGEPAELSGDGPGHNRVAGEMKYRGEVLLFQYDRIAGVITGAGGSAGTIEEGIIARFSKEEEPLVK